MFGMRLAWNYNKYTGRESNLDPIGGSMQHVLGNPLYTAAPQTSRKCFTLFSVHIKMMNCTQ